MTSKRANDGTMSTNLAARILLRISVAALLAGLCHLTYHYVSFTEATLRVLWFW